MDITPKMFEHKRQKILTDTELQETWKRFADESLHTMAIKYLNANYQITINPPHILCEIINHYCRMDLEIQRKKLKEQFKIIKSKAHLKTVRAKVEEKRKSRRRESLTKKMKKLRHLKGKGGNMQGKTQRENVQGKGKKQTKSIKKKNPLSVMIVGGCGR